MSNDTKTIGRPAPLGRKVPVGFRLTPDCKECLQQHPEGYVYLETLLRRSKEFREWLRSKHQRKET